jgi:large subunit ribosomal protein L10
VGELQHVGIPAGISGGKVMIEKTKIVAKEGEVVSGGLAEMLSRLQIYPKEVGLDLRAVKKDDLIYTREILAIDEDMYISDMNKAVEAAFGLAMHVTYATDETIHPLLRIAYINGYNLAVNVPIFEPSVMKDIIYRAYTHMTSLCALTKEVKMEYVYAALLLHSAGKEITEDGVCTVLRSAGMDVDVIKAKSLVSALDGVDIDEAISAQISPVPEVTKKEEKKEEMKEEEEEKEEEEAEISGMEGLGSLFG